MLKELFSYMKQYKKYAWISLVCIAVECIFELVIPLIMADMVDVGIANGDQDYILHKGLVMIGCAGAFIHDNRMLAERAFYWFIGKCVL